jgi:phosphopantothenoylcysteine decarboxylase/phosphopantothenate--cysteine ligase
VRYLEDALALGEKLRGKRALVTAGPTQEAIDPVRYIGNRSSGKMGFAIAERLARLGAKVNLVTGPTSLHTSHPNISVTQVVSAQEMYDACVSAFPETDIAVLAAAVADYRPAVQHEQKIKKSTDQTSLTLVPTKDIAATLGGMKKNGQFVVGFALETDNERANAISKLSSKNLDMIVLNSLRDEGAAFGHDTNKVTIIDREQNETSFELKSKKEVAGDIVNAIIEKIMD